MFIVAKDLLPKYWFLIEYMLAFLDSSSFDIIRKPAVAYIGGFYKSNFSAKTVGFLHSLSDEIL